MITDENGLGLVEWWDCGWSFGFDQRGYTESIATVERELTRQLLDWERAEFASGFGQGVKDREQWRRDQEELGKREPINPDDIPF